jgi:hypothetical protein
MMTRQSHIWMVLLSGLHVNIGRLRLAKGILYYNRGDKMLVRLEVSLHSLRKIYDGDICLLSQGDDSRRACKPICKRYDVQMIKVDYPDTELKRATYLNATLSHEKTPYDTTIWLDSDTLILKPFWEELWAAAEKHEFAIAQLADWKTRNKRGNATKVGNRVLSLKPLYPEWMEGALDYGAAINCGVFSFVKDSKLMADWWKMAAPCRELNWIPDEVCCQMMLHRYSHKLMPHWFNASCKYDDARDEQARICHYHGRKHCRIESYGEDRKDKNGFLRAEWEQRYLFHSDMWYAEFEQVRSNTDQWVKHDRQLKQNIRMWDKLKGEKK